MSANAAGHRFIEAATNSTAIAAGHLSMMKYPEQ
jgi:hypothetical protein